MMPISRGLRLIRRPFSFFSPTFSSPGVNLLQKNPSLTTRPIFNSFPTGRSFFHASPRITFSQFTRETNPFQFKRNFWHQRELPEDGGSTSSTKFLGGMVLLGVVTIMGMQCAIVYAEDDTRQLGPFRKVMADLQALYAEKDVLLPDKPPHPYRKPYTAVIDVKVLLIAEWNFETGWKFTKRPGVDYFLAILAQYYEIVVWSEEFFTHSGPVMERLDPQQNYITYKLFKDSLVRKNGWMIKDLTRLNRDLGQTILLDFHHDDLELNPENGLFVPPPLGNNEDTVLIDLLPFLQEIAVKNYDVRAALRHCKEANIDVLQIGQKAREQSEKMKERKSLWR